MTDVERVNIGKDSVKVSGPGYDAFHIGPRDAADRCAHMAKLVAEHLPKRTWRSRIADALERLARRIRA